jgi:hypothetical protein
MIGSMKEAAEILAAHKKGNVPADWEYLGKGDFRYAYRSPTGVVYKIEKGRTGQSNRGEFERASELRISDAAKAANVYIPRVWLYTIRKTDVIAMEYVSGEYSSPLHSLDDCDCGERFNGTCATSQFLNLESKLGMRDITSRNAVFIPAQKRWALIDLGA